MMMKSLPRMKERRFRLLIPSQVLKTIYTQINVHDMKARVVINNLHKNQVIRPLANRIARKVKKNNLNYLSKLKAKRRKMLMINLRYRPGDQVSEIKQMQQLLLIRVQKTLWSIKQKANCDQC